MEILAGPIAGALDGPEHHLDGLLVGVEVGREAAFVADPRDVARLREDVSERVEHLRPEAQCLGKGRSPRGHDHELLEVHLVIGVGAAVEHVHHRQRKQRLPAVRQPEVQGRLLRRRRGTGGSHRQTEQRVRAQTRLGLAPVELDHGAIERGLLGETAELDALDRAGQLARHVRDRRLHALAAVAGTAVAELHGLAAAGRRARRNGRPSGFPGVEDHVHLDGGIASRIEDLAGLDFRNPAHTDAEGTARSGVIAS